VRCFSNARSEGGDALGPYARACRRALVEYRVAHGVAPEVVGTDGRDATVGPYRAAGEHRFETAEDVLTPTDAARRESFPWVKGQRSTLLEEVVHVRPGDLVRLRRPGRPEARVEKVPEGPAHNASSAARVR
jgi:hypothetical protein